MPASGAVPAVCTRAAGATVPVEQCFFTLAYRHRFEPGTSVRALRVERGPIVAIFAGSPGFQGPTAVSTSAQLVWTGNSTALAALSPAVTLHDITIHNNGPSPVFIGQTAVTAVTGAQVAVGETVTYNGWSVTSGTTTRDVYAICASGSATVEVALATTAINV
jgi:hypothetical protein